MSVDALWAAWFQLLVVLAGLSVVACTDRVFRWLVGLIVASLFARFLLPALGGQEWLLPVLAIMALLALLRITRRMLERIFGPEAANHLVGTWVVRLVDAIVAGPARLLRLLLRSLSDK